MIDDDKTVSKTIWSETVIELLCLSLKKKRPDSEIIQLVKDCRKKGFKLHYLIGKVEKEVNHTEATRMRMLMG